MRILNSCVVWQDLVLQTGVCVRQSSRTLCVPLLVCDKALAQLDFVVVNCPEAVMNVFLPCISTQPDIFAIMNCCVMALSLYYSDIVTWRADIYIQYNYDT